jgi:hypothetical protein
VNSRAQVLALLAEGTLDVETVMTRLAPWEDAARGHDGAGGEVTSRVRDAHDARAPSCGISARLRVSPIVTIHSARS